MKIFALKRNASGQLVYRKPALGIVREDVRAVRAFPFSAPGFGVSLMDREGHELEWIAHPQALDECSCLELLEELKRNEFFPEVRRICAASSSTAPSTWEVETDRGPTSFVIETEESLHRIGPHTLLIASRDGIWFLIRDVHALDAHSRRIVERML